jgi:glycosyltransferase involved in cell wall biosynthesis
MAEGMTVGIVLGIDASRNRSGGAKAHLEGILRAGEPAHLGIARIHIWSNKALLDLLPEAPWLVKHNPPYLERSLPYQVWWQWRHLADEVRRCSCDIVLDTDAGSISRWRSTIVMSQNMLPFEWREMLRYGISTALLRSVLLRIIHTRSLKRAQGVIFLTRYATERVQRATGTLRNALIIPHGVSRTFRLPVDRSGPFRAEKEICCLYVSNTEAYKHHWMVIRAVALLRKRGHRISLTLAGGGTGRGRRKTDRAKARHDPHGTFVRDLGAVPHEDLPRIIAQADIFIFASSCESISITLLEGMAAGVPIACSNRGPMPEVLQDGGVFFDPEDHYSIARAVERLILDADLRASVSSRARARSAEYTWEECARRTWAFVVENVAKGKISSTGNAHRLDQSHGAAEVSSS